MRMCLGHHMLMWGIMSPYIQTGKWSTFGQAAEPGAAGLRNELPSEVIRKLLPGWLIQEKEGGGEVQSSREGYTRLGWSMAVLVLRDLPRRMKPPECTFAKHPMACPCSRPPPKGTSAPNWERSVFQIWTAPPLVGASGKGCHFEGWES